jgi:hypothetical protein
LIPNELSFFGARKSLEECECKGFDSEIARAEIVFGETAILLLSAAMRAVLKIADFAGGDW